MRGIKLIPNAIAIGFGAVDGVVKNADLAAGRTSPVKQFSGWVEAVAWVGAGVLAAAGFDEAVTDPLMYTAGGLLAQRAGMWAGLQITKAGPGRMDMPQLMDASQAGTALPAGTGFAVYPARREPAGILG